MGKFVLKHNRLRLTHIVVHSYIRSFMVVDNVGLLLLICCCGYSIIMASKRVPSMYRMPQIITSNLQPTGPTQHQAEQKMTHALFR